MSVRQDPSAQGRSDPISSYSGPSLHPGSPIHPDELEHTPGLRPQWLMGRAALLIASIVIFPSLVFNAALPTRASLESVEGQVVGVVSFFIGIFWLVLFVYFMRLYRSTYRTEPRFAVVLAVLILDAFRNVVESAFFGVAFSGWAHLIPRHITRLLWTPQIMIMSRLMALATAFVIVWLVAEGGFENLKLREQRNLLLEQRNRELTALQHLASLITSSLEAPVVLQLICRQITDTLHFRSAVFYMIDAPAGILQRAASHGSSDSNAGQQFFPLIGDHPLARVAQSQEWLVLRHSENLSPSEQGSPADPTSVLMPAFDEAGAVGVVHVTLSPDESEPSEHQLSLLSSFLTHACAAIRNAGLHERVLHDRERLDALTRSLEEKRGQLERFVSMLSHDLKSPLVSIEGFLSLLDVECRSMLNEDGRFYLKRVRSNTDHLENLIGRLLEISRAGRVSLTRERVDVERVLTEIVETLKPELDRSKIRVDLHIPLPDIYGDATEIRRVFLNLLENSIKYMGASLERSIQISGWTTLSAVEFLVSDTGIGIAPQLRERVFAMFQRAPEAAGDAEGAGVGLAVVRTIVEAHGGSAWLEPSDTGAAFRLSFPLAPRQPDNTEGGPDDTECPDETAGSGATNDHSAHRR